MAIELVNWGEKKLSPFKTVVGANHLYRISKALSTSVECQEKEKHFTFTVEKSGTADLFLGFVCFLLVELVAKGVCCIDDDEQNRHG